MDPTSFPRVRKGTPGLGFLEQYKGGRVYFRETEAWEIREKFVSGRTTDYLHYTSIKSNSHLEAGFHSPPPTFAMV